MKVKHVEKGYIERKQIRTTDSIMYLFKFFLIVVDETTKRAATFGHFNTEQEAEEFASFNGIILG